MDPTANLMEMRRIASRILDGKAEPSDAERLAELLAALDGWLRGGGPLPAPWGVR